MYLIENIYRLCTLEAGREGSIRATSTVSFGYTLEDYSYA